VTTARERRQHRRKERQRRAASRRLPPVRSTGGRRLQSGGRPQAVRMVGVGQFARGVARRTDAHRRPRGWRRVGSVITGALAAVVFVLWIIARVTRHL
jgi:hypothetical protein